MTDNVFAPPQAKLDVHEGPEALWEMSWKEVRKLYLASVNVRALGFLYGLGAFGSIVAAILFFAGTVGTANAEATPAILAAIIAVFGFLYVAACVTSFTRPAWGRWLGIVLCVLGLLSFPFGTVIGILGLIAYAQGGKLFGPDKLLHKDVALVYKQRKQDKS